MVVDVTAADARDTGVGSLTDLGRDTVDVPAVDVRGGDGGVLTDIFDRGRDVLVAVRDAAIDAQASDAECNALAPFEVNADCQRALGLTQDPHALFTCCDGVCSSQGCGLQGGAVGECG